MRKQDKFLSKAGWLAAVSILILSAGCTMTPVGRDRDIPAWTVPGDCFSRNVLETDLYAEDMAMICSGPEAAADPSRSGIDRATAYFNAAAAFNLLGDHGKSTLACETSSACYQFALKLIEKSFVNQEDALVRKDNASPVDSSHERFVLRRRLAQARALAGVSGSANAGCAETGKCLDAASAALATQDLASLAARPDDPIAVFACKGLALNAQISQLRGAEHEYAAISDLRQIVRSCPSMAGRATSDLAMISYKRGEQLRRSMDASTAASAPSSQSIALGVSAVSSYRDALGSDSVSLSAYRGLGAVYLGLAGLEPEKSAEHFRAARDVFDAAQMISAATPNDAHAGDLEQLAISSMSLARAKPPIDAMEQQNLIDEAIRVLMKSTTLSPSFNRQLILGEAYEQAGRDKEAEAVYRSALADGASTGHETAALSLARLLERSGKAEEALEVLQKAIPSSLQPAALRYEIGRLQFGRSEFPGVIDALSPVAGTLPAAQAAEARYMLSIAETVLQRPGWQARARTHADEAAQADSSSVKYARQSCLSHILGGGPDMKSGASLQRCRPGNTPENHLLRGMYFLKQAQLTDVSAYDRASQDYWRSILRLAQDAFQSGETVLKTDTGTIASSRFDDLGRQIDLAAVLAQGKLVVERCRRDATIEAGSQTWKDLEAFYGHYGVLKCSAP